HTGTDSDSSHGWNGGAYSSQRYRTNQRSGKRHIVLKRGLAAILYLTSTRLHKILKSISLKVIKSGLPCKITKEVGSNAQTTKKTIRFYDYRAFNRNRHHRHPGPAGLD